MKEDEKYHTYISPLPKKKVSRVMSEWKKSQIKNKPNLNRRQTENSSINNNKASMLQFKRQAYIIYAQNKGFVIFWAALCLK